MIMPYIFCNLLIIKFKQYLSGINIMKGNNKIMVLKNKISILLAICLSFSVFASGCNKETDSLETEFIPNIITQDTIGTEPDDAVTAVIAVTDDNGQAVTGADGSIVTEVTATPGDNNPTGQGTTGDTLSQEQLENVINQTTTAATAVVEKSTIPNGDKYAYNQLTEDEKMLYDAMLECVETMRFKINVSDKVDLKIWTKILGLVYNQEPQLFWLDSKSKVGRLYFNEYDADVIAKMKKEIDETVNKLLNEAKGKSSTYDKLKVFHDYLVLNSTFELGDAESGSYNSSIYAAFSKANGSQGNVQCAGYAKAMKYLCDKSGINCMVITGNNKKGDTHAWNIVDVNGEWYNLDVTWDDPILSTPDPNYLRNAFFLVPDSWVKDNTHFNANVRTLSSGGSITYFKPPACTSTSQNYFTKNNMVYNDSASAEAAIKAQIDKVVAAKGRVIEIRCETKSVYDSVYKNIKDFQTYARDKSSAVKGLSDMCNEGMLLIELDVQYN